MSLQACANIVHRADTARWRAAMAAPLEAREILLPIYAANAEIGKAPWVTKEHLIAEMRLQWWRDALDEIVNGKPRRHEVVDALAEVLPPAGAIHLGHTIDARSWDIYQQPFETAEDLMAYTDPTTFGPMAASYLALGGCEDGLQSVKGLAIGLGFARFMQGFVDIQAATREDITPDWDVDYIQLSAHIALNVFQRSKKALRLKTPETAALIEAAGADRFLKHITKHPQKVLDGTVPAFAVSSALSRARCAWRIKAPGA